MFQYKTEPENGNPSRQAYLDGINALLNKLRTESENTRAAYRKDIFDNPEKYRKEFRAMLGWPLTETFSDMPEVKKEFLTETDGVKIYRVTLTLLDCIPFWGLLFVTDEQEKKPLVIASHGGLGTPELVSGILPGGSANYNDMVWRVMQYGANVFAPQLLLWDPKVYKVTDAGNGGTDAMRHDKDIRLKQFGSSITAIELHSIERALDWLVTEPFVDADRIGMVGLSYGGFYTLFAAAADTRIRASVSSCFFNDRTAHCWEDWTWMNSGNTFSDVETAALVYPRSICLQVGTNDPLFNIDAARETFRKFREFAGERGNYAYLMDFEGTHEFSNDDAPIVKMMEELNK